MHPSNRIADADNRRYVSPRYEWTRENAPGPQNMSANSSEDMALTLSKSTKFPPYNDAHNSLIIPGKLAHTAKYRHRIWCESDVRPRVVCVDWICSKNDKRLMHKTLESDFNYQQKYTNDVITHTDPSQKIVG